MPLARPVASMMVLFWFAPMSESDLLTITSSLYVPATTLIVSLGAGAAMAAPIVAKQPFVPPGFTHNVAAAAVWAIPASSAAPNAFRVWRRAMVLVHDAVLRGPVFGNQSQCLSLPLAPWDVRL